MKKKIMNNLNNDGRNLLKQRVKNNDCTENTWQL